MSASEQTTQPAALATVVVITGASGVPGLETATQHTSLWASAG
jgi:hypothetical protein